MIIGLLITTGCTAEREDGGAARRAAEPSLGTVVDNASSRWTGANGWQIDTSRYTVVGSGGDSVSPEFALVTHVGLGTMGTIVVVDVRARRLLFADGIGAAGRMVGRRGGGPGEFESPMRALFCRGDSVVVWDNRRRLSVWDRSGRFVREVASAAVMLPGWSEVHGITPDCGAALVSHTTEFRGPVGHGTDSMRLVWYALRDTGQQVVAERPGYARAMVEYGWTRAAVQPWAGPPLLQTLGEHVVVGHGDRAEYQVLAADGTVLRTVRWRAMPRPIDRAERARYEALRRRVVQQGRDSEEDYPPLDVLMVPSHMPYSAELLIDAAANVWLRRYETAEAIPSREFLLEQASHWTVFDATGQLLGDVAGPAGLRILAITDDAVIGERVRDADGSLEIRAYSLRKGAKPK